MVSVPSPPLIVSVSAIFDAVNVNVSLPVPPTTLVNASASALEDEPRVTPPVLPEALIVFKEFEPAVSVIETYPSGRTRQYK